MGAYLNPGNEGFQQILNTEYIDKTGLIKLINRTLNSIQKFTCVSRPRRFGKTMAAKMLCAYYDKNCDSKALFDGLEISKDADYEKHLNQYNVIYLDITRFIARVDNIEDIVSDIQDCVIAELREFHSDVIKEGTHFLSDALLNVYDKTGEKFFFIIDEWDALFREAKHNTELQKSYVQLLRGLFKGGPITDKTILGAYMTGILPIKKYGTESALTDFREYTMVKPAMFAEYVGFTEDEVKALCEHHHMDYGKMEQWYDGYSFHKMKHIYSPNSVMNAIGMEEYGSYWTTSETYESLQKYISMNMDGLRDSIVAMLGGQRVRIKTLSFQNDMVSMDTRDKVLTLLIHLGYLAYDDIKKQAYIPNLEVAEAFQFAIEDSGWKEVKEALENSVELLEQTIAGNSEYVAASLEKFHQNATSILKYNDENSLSCALTIAYYTARSDYQIIRELPTGKGFADLAFVPRSYSDKPAMIIELKYDKTAATALQQIKDKNYDGPLKEFYGKMLLVGISYDKDKGHSCVIERG